MKIRIQFTPELAAALFCAGGWFAFWIFVFRPVPFRPAVTAGHPEVIRLIADDETLRKLKAPTLFALPSIEGFSGPFLESRIDLRPLPEKPASPVRYLPRTEDASAGADQALLTSKTVIPQNKLPVPGAVPLRVTSSTSGTQLFPSPELAVRTGDSLQLTAAAAGLPETVRVNLSVRADGTVEHAFFDTPVTNAILLSAVRQLRFKPAAQPTESWLDIRFAREEKR